MLGSMHLFELVFSFFFLDIYQTEELLDHTIVSFEVSWGTSILFSSVAAPIYIPSNKVQGFPSPILSPPFVICRPWWKSFWPMRGDISLLFRFEFLWLLAMLNIFPSVCYHLYVFFGEMSIQISPAHFFLIELLVWGDTELNELLFIFWILTPCPSHHL